MSKLIKQIMESEPEYSAGSVLKCVKWDYKNMIFKFIDTETDKTYTVNGNMLSHGYSRLIQYLRENDLRKTIVLLKDPGNWDADYTDMLVQFAIFGKQIYG